MISRKSEWKLGLPVPGLKGIRLLHDSLYKDGKKLKTQPQGYVVLRSEGMRGTRCVTLEHVRFAVATGQDIFMTFTKQLARDARKSTRMKAIRDHILWMQTVLMGIEMRSPEAVFEYLHGRYYDDLMRVLVWKASKEKTYRTEMAIWNAMKDLAEQVTNGCRFVYAPAPYLIQTVKQKMAERTYY